MFHEGRVCELRSDIMPKNVLELENNLQMEINYQILYLRFIL